MMSQVGERIENCRTRIFSKDCEEKPVQVVIAILRVNSLLADLNLAFRITHDVIK